MTRWRVLLADDHQPSIRCWRTLLEPQFEVVGAVADGVALVEAVDCVRPDIIVTDVVLPVRTGVAAVDDILRRHPGIRAVFVTVYADQTLLRQALAAGAFGYVLKVRAGDDLLPAVEAAVHGQLLISPFPSPGGPPATLPRRGINEARRGAGDVVVLGSYAERIGRQ